MCMTPARQQIVGNITIIQVPAATANSNAAAWRQVQQLVRIWTASMFQHQVFTINFYQAVVHNISIMSSHPRLNRMGAWRP